MNTIQRSMEVTSKSYYDRLKKLILGGHLQVAGPMLGLYLKRFGISRSRKVSCFYLCKKDPSKALAFVGGMAFGRVPCSISMVLVDSLVKEGRACDANEYVVRAGEEGSSLDVFVYSVVVDGLCKQGFLEKALELCASMKRRGVVPNVVTYNAVINGLCRQGCLIEAFRLFGSMERVGILPTVTTYGTLISCLCGEGFLQDAVELFEMMVGKGIAPNMHVYNSLVYGHSRFGLVEGCGKFLRDAEMESLQPDCFTVSAVISGFCVKGDMEGALEFYYRYQKRDRPPDFFGFYGLIKGLCSKGRVEETRGVLRDMLQCQPVAQFINRTGGGACVGSLTSSISILCEKGRIKDAVGLLSEVGYIAFPSSSARMHEFDKDSHSKRLQVMESVLSSSGRPPSDTNPIALQPQEEIGRGPCPLPDSRDPGRSKIQSEMMDDGEFLEYSEISRLSPFDFDRYYSMISLLCSKGKLLEAANLAKKMLVNLKESG